MDRGAKLHRLASDYWTQTGRPVLSYTVREGWILVNEWRVMVNGGVTVPAFFRFDLASVPRPFWGLIAPFDCSIEAPLVHDFLYRFHEADGRVWRRREVDRLFRRIMKTEGVRAWRRSAAWLAVRLFGWWAWRQSPKLVAKPVTGGF